MELYFVQHAEAKREEEDPARPLSEKGWKSLEKGSSFLIRLDVKVARILHSGKLRARQTAEKLGEVVDSLEVVKEIDGLKPLDNPNIWGDRLREEIGNIMLVGHLPHLSKLVGLLISGGPDQKVVDFKNGGVVCLVRDDEEGGNWSVLWVIIPQILG